MAHYRTFIADLLRSLSQELVWGIQSQLAGLFGACTGDHFENNWVYIADISMKPVGHELLVYFMPPNVSVIKHVPRQLPPDLSAAGNTAFLSGASEVYVRSTSPKVLARLAFHELMHNRLRLNDRALHPQGGLASAEINDSTEYTDANKRAMAAVINRPIKQWTEGITILTHGIKDPISEYYSP